jgi:two-component system, NtrC family, response regulator HydG
MTSSGLFNKTILVIEDSHVCTDLIRAYFRKSGANLLFADRGSEGWRLFINNDIDIVLADLRLPDSEGLSLVTRLKKSKPHIPVVVQTACTFDFSREDCKKAGCDSYIAKPYDSQAFISTVLAALEGKEPFHFKTRC